MTANGQISLYNYSSGGDLTAIKYASGLTRIWTYDGINLVNGSALYNENSDLLASISLSHNWNGKVAMITQPQNLSTELLYDTSGRVFSTSTPSGHRFVEITSVTLGSITKSHKFGDQVSMTVLFRPFLMNAFS